MISIGCAVIVTLGTGLYRGNQMALYDYRCEQCGYAEEVFQHIGQKPIKKKCNCGAKMERLISGGLIGVVKDVKTVGSLIDKNTRVNRRKIEEQQCEKQEKANKGKKLE